jgi:putative colanic acid biosynthesis UDP-glucose lipid carrier transferase
MTGLAQVRGFRKGHLEVEKRLECDLYYVEHRSLWLYLWILSLTIRAVIKYEVW